MHSHVLVTFLKCAVKILTAPRQLNQIQWGVYNYFSKTARMKNEKGSTYHGGIVRMI